MSRRFGRWVERLPKDRGPVVKLPGKRGKRSRVFGHYTGRLGEVRPEVYVASPFLRWTVSFPSMSKLSLEQAVRLHESLGEAIRYIEEERKSTEPTP